MIEIDYEALAKVLYVERYGDERGWKRNRSIIAGNYIGQVRAVVAALRDQGLVVVRREPLRGLVAALDEDRPHFPPYLDEAKAALAATGPTDDKEKSG